MTSKIDSLPTAFIWRRLHSLTGLWLVIFLIEHLITNSQAALLLGESGKGFVRMVNLIHDLPYLQVIEILLLGIPIVIHGFWGVRYALTAKFNSRKSDGTKPYLKSSRNKSFTWQRLTSWILLILLTLHIVKFRFLEYPGEVNKGADPKYYVTVSMDPGLYTVADRLDVTLYNAAALDQLKREGERLKSKKQLEKAAGQIREKGGSRYSEKEAQVLEANQSVQERENLIQSFTSVKLRAGEVLASSSSFGTASLLTVRDTFKSPVWVGIYTIFVLSAVFHAFNGLWTSMLTWGWMIKMSAQQGSRKVAIGLMVLIGLLGLVAIWGTYFLNLKQ